MRFLINLHVGTLIVGPPSLHLGKRYEKKGKSQIQNKKYALIPREISK